MKHTDVIIIGNGPSGISLSYMLSGNRPFYNGDSHSNTYLQARLESNACVSLVEQDLEQLCGDLEGRSPNPVAVLFDAVTHPDTDIAADLPSLLRWEQHSDCAVPHVVLGKTAPGGAWQLMDLAQMQTLSLGNWMELPNLPFKNWLQKRRRCSEAGDSYVHTGGERACMLDVQAYYADYVHAQALAENSVCGATVTSVERVLDVQHRVDADSGEQQPCSARHDPHCLKWEVRGLRTVDDTSEEFCYRARSVVLATGATMRPRRLHVAGENLPYVAHSLSQIDTRAGTLLVVGSGLSAADAVLLAFRNGIAVIHVFRRQADDPQVMLQNLPATLYPEYRRVYELMSGRRVHPAYQPYMCHRVREFGADGSVLLCGDAGDVVVDVTAAAVLIGGRPDLEFLPNASQLLRDPTADFSSVSNPLRVNPHSLECVGEPGLYAMGALVGDNFVRFLSGGALAISSHLWQLGMQGSASNNKTGVAQTNLVAAGSSSSE